MFFMEKTIDVKTSRPVLRHKMYKSGKKWIVAGIAGAAAMTYSMTVHADTTSQQVTTNSTQDINAGGNAVTSTGTQTNNNTTTTLNVSAASSQSQPSTNALYESKVADSQQGTIYTPVNVDHSKLDNAVKQASDAGVRMVHDNDTVQNTTNENVDSARQAIEDQYNDQIADINRQAAHARQETSNYNTYNGNQGDHSGLDQTVQNAQSVPGLSISKSNNQNTTVDPANDSQINQWKTNTQNDYSSQTAAINNAIATQKQNNREYEQKLAEYNTKLSELQQDHHAIGTAHYTNGGLINLALSYDLTWHYDVVRNTVIVTNSNVTLKENERTYQTNGNYGFWDTVIFERPDIALPSEPGHFIGADTPEGTDLPGVNGEVLWNKYKNGALAFFSQESNKDHPYVIHYGSATPYEAKNNGDGTFTVIKTAVRSRDSNAPADHLEGQDNWVVWGESEPTVTISLPMIPTRRATNVHYHYDTNLIGTNLRIIRLLLTMIVVSYFPIFSDYLFLQVLLQYVNMFSA